MFKNIEKDTLGYLRPLSKCQRHSINVVYSNTKSKLIQSLFRFELYPYSFVFSFVIVSYIVPFAKFKISPDLSVHH